MARSKKIKEEIFVDDEIIENPEEVTIEDVVEEVVQKPSGYIIQTGKVVNGKREFKDTRFGVTFIED